MWARIAMGAGFAALVAYASPALAVTETDYYGHWVNVDPATRSLVSVDIANGPGTTIRVHPYGQCHPTPCDWGEALAEKVPIGVALRYRVTFDQGFATKRVRFDIYSVGTLRVSTIVHFTDGSGRADYTTIDVFNH